MQTHSAESFQLQMTIEIEEGEEMIAEVSLTVEGGRGTAEHLST